MREYETWEVIKMLGENPKLRFINGIKIGHMYDDGGVVVSNTIGFIHNKLYFIKSDGTEFVPFAISEEVFAMKWQLVRTPVTWQEAIQAWSEGKTISCDQCQGKRDEICNDCRLSTQVFNQKGDCLSPICKAQIKTGTWYIGGSDAV